MVDMIKILCVDDERNVLKSLRRLFMDEDNYEVFVAESGAEGLDLLEEEGDIRMVISDYRMPEMTGVEFLHQVNEKWPETMRIVLSGYADTAAVVEAINEGQIYKFIPKPWNDEELLSTISSALQHQDLQWENRQLSAELQQKNIELQEMNDNLEEQVIRRTEALDIRNRILQVSQGVLDVIPVVVFGIDPENLIVHCNEYARDLFPHGGIGPLGNERNDVFPPEINELIDRLEHERLPQANIEVHNQKFRGEVRRLHDTQMQGLVLVLIPEA
ncbi:MAG: response regulator [Desulfuromusa sp.]